MSLSLPRQKPVNSVSPAVWACTPVCLMSLLMEIILTFQSKQNRQIALLPQKLIRAGWVVGVAVE